MGTPEKDESEAEESSEESPGLKEALGSACRCS